MLKNPGPNAQSQDLAPNQLIKCLDRVLSRHLFSPLIHEVSVIQWACFDVRSLGRRLNVVVVEWLADKCGCRFLNLDWRRGYATQHNPCLTYSMSIVFDISSHTKDRKIEGAATSQFLIRGAPTIRRR